MPQISIDKPCPEKWGLMQKQEQGRYCLSCEKTVIDFSKKTTEELKAYLQNRKGEEVCVHCRVDQVETPGNNPKRYRWMVNVLIFIFGISLISSCFRRAQGCAAYVGEPKQDRSKKEVKADTSHLQHFR